MGIHIGNDNKIKNSTIVENSKIAITAEKKNFADRHPIITGLIIAVASGFILSLSFWDKIRNLIEKLGE